MFESNDNEDDDGGDRDEDEDDDDDDDDDDVCLSPNALKAVNFSLEVQKADRVLS